MSKEAILQAIPHRDPFLLVDEIVSQEENRIVCKKTFTGKEFWYAGHYPKFPLTPGVLLCEAAMQAGAILLSSKVNSDDSRVPVATGADKVQFKKMVLPGDTIAIEVDLLDELSGKFFLKGRVLVEGKLAARLNFSCTLTTVTV